MFLLPLLILLLILSVYLETNIIRVRHVQWDASTLPVPPSKPFRILHISDLHLSTQLSIRRLRKTVELAIKSNADIVLISGDFGHPMSESMFPQALAALHTLAMHLPTVAVLGNWDIDCKTAPARPFPQLLTLLQEAGITLLVDQKKRYFLNGQPVDVVGMTNGFNRNSLAKAGLKLLDDPEDTNRVTTLLLHHRPEFLYQAEDFHWDLSFSGHTHGGQIRIPIINYKPIMKKRKQPYADPKVYTQTHGRAMNVSGGVGNYCEVRLFCPPEITVFDLILPTSSDK